MTRDDDTRWIGTRHGEPASMAGRGGAPGRSALQAIEDHWRELRVAADGLPRREDVQTARIGAALPHAFVLERVAAGQARFRIAGRAIVDVLGGEVRGLPLSVLFTPKGRSALEGWLARCFDGPALVDLLVEASQGPLRQPLRGRLLLLPLLDQDGQPARILGGLLTDSVPRRANPRFDLSDAVPRVETVAPRPAPRRAFAVAPSMPGALGMRESERPYLRLVVSNR